MSAEDSCRREIEVTIPAEEIATESERIVSAYRGQVRVPGFRPGKAPTSVVRTRFSKEIEQEIVETVLPRAFWKHVEENNLKILGAPDVRDVHFHAGEPLTFKASFDVAPVFELGEYRRLEAPFSEPQVANEEIDGELERLREEHASYRNLDPRPLADGDIAVISLKSGEVEGIDPINQEETTMTIGEAGTVAGFSEALRGKSPGDEVDFEVTYPEDFGNESLAGKTVPFHAVIKGMREKELPELDDEFAAEVGDFRSLDEMKTRLREAIRHQRRRAAEDAAKEKLLDTLVKNHDFPVPQRMVDRQIDSRLERSLRAFRNQGIDPSQLDLDWKKLRENERPRAERDVKGGFIIDRIAEVENIKPTQEEVDAQIQMLAQRDKISMAEARRKLSGDGTLDRINDHLRHEKTLAFLFDEAEKVEPADEPEQPVEEPAAESVAVED